MSLLLRLLWRLSFVCLIYQFLRLGFLARNIDQLATDQGMATAFWHGMRFDISAVTLSNSLYVALILIGTESVFPKMCRWLFVATNTIFIFFNLGDIEYFPFSGNRITWTTFSMGQDFYQQSLQLAWNYWYLIVITVACAFILYLAHGPKNLFQLNASAPKYSKVGVRLALLALAIFAVRGGWQAKPLAQGHAYLYGNPQLTPLTLNSTFTLLKSSKGEHLNSLHFYPSWEALNLAQTKENHTTPQLDNKTNVVIIILESFGREYMGYQNPWPGYTPFLDELAAKGHFFDQSYVNGRRSIDAIPSILAGIPSLMVSPFVTSEYQTRQITGLPKIFAERGYTTSFFHGGHDGTMFFDVLASRLGFAHYYGANAFPDQTQDDGHWGIFDEPFLQWSLEKLTSTPKPFFSTIFTLSSHNPYTIPEAYQSKFVEGTLPIHKSIRYTDYALRKFFESAEKTPWFANTLFIVTADHTSISEYPQYQKDIGLFRAPIILFHPTKPLHLEETLAQHVDIMPTTLDLFGFTGEKRSRFGQSLVKRDPTKAVTLFGSSHYWYITGKNVMKTTLQFAPTYIYNWQNDPLLEQPLAQIDPKKKARWEHDLKRTLQYYHNGLIENKLNW